MALHGCLQTVAGSPRCPVNPPSGRLKNEGLETPSIPTQPSDLDTSSIARNKRKRIPLLKYAAVRHPTKTSAWYCAGFGRVEIIHTTPLIHITPKSLCTQLCAFPARP